ncbi:MAG: prepilin-type N-terminal cleavage/methylation domain-containing protein [Sulfurovum sp.]|nr:prepilin-type N-terminal cleavage/methylation domain-containing protein [Sulfurovum sp.]
MKTLRPAFTLIEILVSVLILSGAIVYVLKIHSQNHEQITYISERNKHALEDTLFLGKEVLRYHKSEKSAYDLLQNEIKVDDFKSRRILKALKRHIYIPEPIDLSPEEETQGPAAIVNEIKIKADYPATYFRFELRSL